MRNDTYGHLAGDHDRGLIQFAETLKKRTIAMGLQEEWEASSRLLFPPSGGRVYS
jgi:hypothetical protein